MSEDTLDFTSQKLHITTERDTTIDFEVTYGEVANEAFDITNYTARLRIKETFLSSSHVFEATSDAVSGSRLIKDNAAGKIRVFITNDDMDDEDIPNGEYVYDMVIYYGEDVRRVIAGKFTLNSIVTDAP